MRTPGSTAVVVGVNGASAGLAAVRLGAREAVARGRALKVVHAFTWPDHRHGVDDRPYAPARRAAAQVVAAAVAGARRTTPGVRVSGALIDGLPIRVLLQQSRTADLLVLADDDVAGSRPRLESVLLQVVSRSCPTVVARGTRPPSGPVLAAVDGSATSLEALWHAVAEARRRAGGIEVVHVTAGSGPEAERAGRAVLDAAVAAVPGAGSARRRLLAGDPARTLVRASRHARMVIVGPRGSDGASLLGPVAQELLRRCACPTLFVHGTTAGRRRSAGTVPSAGATAT